MKGIEIFACPEHCEEFFKLVIPFRQSSFGRWRQVAADNVGRRRPRYRTEIPTAAQVRRRIDLRRLLAKVGVSAREEFGSGTGGVAAIAVTLSVDNVTT